MSTLILRKVPYKLKSRLVWGFVLAQQEGLTLLFVPKLSAKSTHAIVVAMENPATGHFEDAKVTRFPIETSDLEAVGERFGGLANGLEQEDFRRLFRMSEGWKGEDDDDETDS